MSFAHQSGGGGVTVHGLLFGLLDDDHPQYALLSGRSGGQSLIGGLAAGEHLTLQSTAHATRGYVRAQDDLQLLSDCLRGSDGSQRLKLAAASPQITLTGDIRIPNQAAIGSAAAIAATKVIDVQHDFTAATGLIYGIYCALVGSNPTGAPTVYGLAGYGRNLSGLGGSAYGLNFSAQDYSTGPTLTSLIAQYLSLIIGTTAAQAITEAAYIKLAVGAWTFPSGSIANAYGINMTDISKAQMTTVYGLRIADFAAGGTRYLLELGPATPYLRLVGGAAPAADLTNLYLNVGGTLLRISAGAADSGGASYRLLRVPN